MKNQTQATVPDQIYTEEQPMLVDFRFDERVAAVFPDMIRRSVPGYSEIISLLGLFAQQYSQPNSNIYDLGCSLGASTLALRERISAEGCLIIAVDNSEAMIEQCEKNLQQLNSNIHVDLRCADIRDVEINNASVVVLNFTLQFIPQEERAGLIQKIYDGLLPGGVLILSEKVAFNNPEEQQQQQALHITFKQANGYSELEISQKRAALEQVLVPETIAAHQQRLQDVGFDSANVWFQCLNFASIVATK
ncbi:MAG: carboxy-S-adenosyl-L-methionine synthase CmoA [Gammaproteobacteria bacterium]|nr:carboxy-S-adenosyl-L-methionine synthase CmoA [Gammaproteobacteria bacterium]